ncbi:protein kinase domain-containing protein [Xanthomonas hortorum]|uniref:protein kinase domain-containing protein n=1 Tax=Xanthomonas hortorum TaxID=56454 RepID=UPI0029364196|nr:protein kinase [Xanthomonas hortorum]MDV2453689.1 protein kinase [Xanthomonas hortorum NBC5720]
MEALPWKNLKERLSEISVTHARSLLEQLAAAAKFLEDRGLAHRDIKPENIAVSEDLTALKLLDLGVIRPFGVGGLTDLDARVFIGTLRYSSPEFLDREELDTEEGWRALTFYQIGAVLHDMLMHKEIFEKYSEPFALLVNAVKSVNPEVYGSDVELVRICRNCLVKDPIARLEIVNWEQFTRAC